MQTKKLQKIDTQKKKQPKFNSKDGHQTTREENKCGMEEKYLHKPKTIKKMAIGKYISIITINVSGLSAPNKRHRLAEWIQKQDPYIYCLQGTHFRPRDTNRLKVREWKKVFHANRNQKKGIMRF